MTDYSNLKPIPGESVYVEFLETEDLYGVIGEQSEFCYATYSDIETALEYANTHFELAT